MDIKIAKYFPLGLAGMAALAEIISIIEYRFNPMRYLFGGYIDLWSVVSLLSFALKIVFILGALYLYKLYSQSNLKQVKVLAGALFGLFIFKTIVGQLARNWYGGGGIARYLLPLIFLLLVTNIVIALTSKDPNFPQVPKQQRPPVFYQQQNFQPPQAPQQFVAPAGQTIPDQLAALQVLVDNGTLTQAEFKAAKQRIIGA